jgi:GT2 family glycosyltransferase
MVSVYRPVRQQAIEDIAMSLSDEIGGLAAVDEVLAPRLAPSLSVIIPHYQDLVRLDRCLEAVEAQSIGRRNFEIIVADNNSPVGPAAVEQCIRGRAQLVVVTNKGAGMARNGGVRVAKGEILAFTDSDCIPEPDWLAEGLKCLAHNDLVGGRMAVLVDDAAAMTPEEAFERIFAFDNEYYVKKLGFTVTANLICPRTLFDNVGEFAGASVAEDTQWCYRAKAAGYRIGYAPRSVVGHPARKSWDELLRKWRRMNTDNFGLATENGRGRLRWFLRSLLLPASAVAHTPKALFGAGVDTFGQRLAALGVLYRLRLWRTGHSIQLLRRANAG